MDPINVGSPSCQSRYGRRWLERTLEGHLGQLKFSNMLGKWVDPGREIIV